ncbi:hypothetical protein R4227_06005 [Gordonia amicalis]|uniref:hypothetical protein n=1 Tax=Gordonia amicalis TaxID=89053 RepID=UPI00295447B8|nr:hypothetical protein [Gordonia amicalis]MDV7099695.1 hypothetical protein [Gordonia amicalis]
MLGGPELTYDELRAAVAAIIAAMPDLTTGRPRGYTSWGVDGGRSVGEHVPGASWAVDLRSLHEPQLSEIAARVRDALVRNYGVQARLETETADIPAADTERRRLSLPFRERLWDDDAFTPIGEEPPAPAFVGQLLARLRLEDAPKAEQIDGIRNWLANNKPHRSLIRSLRRRGFGDVLDEQQDPR